MQENKEISLKDVGKNRVRRREVKGWRISRRGGQVQTNGEEKRGSRRNKSRKSGHTTKQTLSTVVYPWSNKNHSVWDF